MKNSRRFVSIFFVFMSLLATGPVPAAAAPAQDLAGHWEGVIELPGTKLAVDLDFVRQSDGTWKGDISKETATLVTD